LISAYISLTKPTITALVVMTCLPGLLLATHIPNVVLTMATLIGTALVSGSSAVFNQILDSDIDRVMTRTSKRPIPLGTVSNSHAITFAIVIGLLGLTLLYVYAHPLAAFIALAAHLFYGFFYTVYLKPRTDQNIVIGGAAGAVGPLIGFAAITGEIGIGAVLLFLLIFLWTPPHFWALAIKYRDEYAKANIPMLPVTAGLAVTKTQMLWYCLSLVPVVFYFSFLASSLWASGINSFLTLMFVYKAWVFKQQPDETGSMSLFIFSCFYLLIVFLVISLDRLILLLQGLS
jgi:heme o synthase